VMSKGTCVMSKGTCVMPKSSKTQFITLTVSDIYGRAGTGLIWLKIEVDGELL
jgi:hypothetical protein